MPPAQTTLRETIAKTLPATVTVDGETLDVDLVWASEVPEKVPMPSWLVDFMPATDITRSADAHEAFTGVTDTVPGEQHTYNGEAETVLDEMDVASVTSVTGTAGGSGYTFISGTDYVLVDSDDDNAEDALQWKVGGTWPDLGTNVTVTYEQRLLERTRARAFRQVVAIHLIAKPMKVDEQAAGQPSQKLRAPEVIEAMIDTLIDWFEADLAPALDTAGLSLGPNLSIGKPFQLDGSSHLQTEATFSVDWQKDVTLDRVQHIRKVVTSVKVERA